MTNTARPTPAGWYTDPGGSGHLRWWDGSAWTDHLAPQPTPEPTPVFQAPEPAPSPASQMPAYQMPAHQAAPNAAPADQAPAYQATPNQAPAFAAASPQANAFAVAPTDYGAYGAEYSGGTYAGPTSWNTPWAWILALCPIYFVGLSVISSFLIAGHTSTAGPLTTSPGEVIDGSGILLGLILLVVLALIDNLRLKRMGYSRTAGWGWVFLTPLVYLIIRTVRVFAETRRGIAVLILHIVIGVVALVVYIVFSVILAASIVSGLGLANSSSQFTSGLVKGLDQNGGNYKVACPSVIPDTIGARFSCTATDASTNAAHVLTIEVVTGSDGKPTVKLLSVDPPISK
jgi:hypothetical protein